jgi:hypothetical protein
VSVHSSSTPRSDLKKRFVELAGLGENPSVWELVNAVKEIPYGRPSDRSPDGVITEWRGTCSTKHALLALLLEDRPEFDFQLFHRVYRVSPSMFPAAVVPSDGLVDVHTYGSLVVEGRTVAIDVTFPGEIWDGTSDMTLACGPGEDYPAGDAPWELKVSLVERFCDPSVREPFIASLSG